MGSNLTFLENVKTEVLPRIKSPEQSLAKSLNKPFSNAVSGSRSILNEIQYEHAMPLIEGEVPIIGTGYEMRYGEKSSSNIEADEDYEILAKIPKYSFRPDDHYFMIYRKIGSNTLDIEERVEYHHTTETFGYMYNNKYMDNANVGDVIKKGSKIKTSTSMDEYGNRIDGINVPTLYCGICGNMEDGMWISDEIAWKLRAPILKKTYMVFNDNHIPLNIYGDAEVYKITPDIAEEVVNGILAVNRQEDKEQCLFMQSEQNLRKIMMSDEKYTLKGTVIDIDIYSNNPAMITGNRYYNQLSKYYEETRRFSKDVYDFLNNYMKEHDMNYDDHLSYKLQELYTTSEEILAGTMYIRDNVFSNTIVEVTTLEISPVGIGDKLADRYGGKGVVTKIIPVDMMPFDQYGNRVHIIKNSYTMNNRVNPAQCNELSLTFIGQALLYYISNFGFPAEEAMEIILSYLAIVSPKLEEDLQAIIETMSGDELNFFVNSIINDGAIFTSIKPISESLTIDDIAKLYDLFPFIHQIDINVPITGSNGKVRFVPARRRSVVAPMYMYRLKQYAEEKFSVTSLSATNIRNENTRSKASKNHTALHTNTPVKFGEAFQHFAA